MHCPCVLLPIKDRARFVAYTRAKVPINPKSHAAGKVNNRATWATYGEAQRAAGRINGHVGMIAGNEFLCLDFDDVVENGKVHPWVQDQIDEIGGYTELSVSGTGIHILVPMCDELRALLPSKRRIESDQLPVERVELITGNNGVILGQQLEAPVQSVEDQQTVTIRLVEFLFSLAPRSRRAHGQRRRLSSPERAVLRQQTGEVVFDENIALAAASRGGSVLRAYFNCLWVKQLDPNRSGRFLVDYVLAALTRALRKQGLKTAKKTARRLLEVIVDLGFAERLSPAVIRLRSPGRIAELLGTRLGSRRSIPLTECLTRTPKRSLYLGIAARFDSTPEKPRPVSRAVRRTESGVCAATQRKAERTRDVTVAPNYVVGSPSPGRSWRHLHDGRICYRIANSTEVHPIADPERLGMRMVRRTDRRRYFYPDLHYGSEIAKSGALMYLGKAALDDGELVNLWGVR